jgi:hypothetical protein
MSTKLIFATGTTAIEQWTELPFAPRIHEWLNAQDMLKSDETNSIK